MGLWTWRRRAPSSKQRTMPRDFVSLLFSRKPSNHNGAPSHQPTQAIISLPGATIATLLMLGALHAKRLYEEKKIDEERKRGIGPAFVPDAKAAFLQFLPLRSISHAFGFMASLEIPVWVRPHVYKAYCRAFHANVDEAAVDLKNYSCLRDFFSRTLKEGSRPLDEGPTCLLSPVDGVILGCGEVRAPGVIEQVKGFSYSMKSLLGAEPTLFHSKGFKEQEVEKNEIQLDQGNVHEKHTENPLNTVDMASRSDSSLFYCVLYLGPGDYHRVHSPIDWHILCRRHFSGKLFPVNERASRTIKNLYVTNERVVLEGKWSQGYMALVAVGAFNVGSIELTIEPGLKTNCPRWNPFSSEPCDVQRYGEKDAGLFVKRGQEMVVFNLGSTVILVFQVSSNLCHHGTGAKLLSEGSPGFSFIVKRGTRVRMGQALGHW